MPTRGDADLAKQLWAVGDPVRLRILRLLPQMADCQHESNVSSLALKLGLSQPTVSHHLRVLRQAGMVSYRKMCRDVYYWIEPEAAGAMLRTLEQVFAGAAEAKPARRRSRGRG
ncbi:MAG: metalloregulator ArsR/SmtB family transcription factor [Opitutales bacterium]|jgi:ArsR family transcriptional regulator